MCMLRDFFQRLSVRGLYTHCSRAVANPPSLKLQQLPLHEAITVSELNGLKNWPRIHVRRSVVPWDEICDSFAKFDDIVVVSEIVSWHYETTVIRLESFINVALAWTDEDAYCDKKNLTPIPVNFKTLLLPCVSILQSLREIALWHFSIIHEAR